ncbi:hypothetical protein XM38_025770 [Halomicronema hongdechloris C2206]|uniref:Uncharacterized protein n=1 Tax=Halomicronema hongdechloris C2206 TaxID=1641165 RepID=A0A1Z3HMT1_9CYAN|nr:hypothetical protein [Halomicronema hongdechloris]ASC71624.1 hypothetical protein XM38_025770 [Halomicronema hongdechloris C2206]
MEQQYRRLTLIITGGGLTIEPLQGAHIDTVFLEGHGRFLALPSVV